MIERAFLPRGLERPSSAVTADPLWLCVKKRDDTVLWLEFLCRVLPKLRHLACASDYRFLGNASPSRARILSVALPESGLAQMIVVRLIGGDCALLKRFRGKTEDDCLAVIFRPVICDFQARRSALKRDMVWLGIPDRNSHERLQIPFDIGYDESETEHVLLSHEVAELGEHMVARLGGPSSVRDGLIFQLYFHHDVSLHQIARCRGINLTKVGVVKVLNRFKKQLQELVTVGMTGVAA